MDNYNRNCIRTYHASDRRWSIHHGNVETVLPTMSNSLYDGALFDPPYALTYMGNDWDKVLPPTEVFQYILRVCKPGAFMLAFGHPKTFHRLATRIEDAGWKIHDTISWLYGNNVGFRRGFGSQVDRLLGCEPHLENIPRSHNYGYFAGNSVHKKETPTSEIGKVWAEYGTELKGCWEPVIVAMKPRKGTFAQNALNYGVAGLHLDGIRRSTNNARHPANVLLCPETAERLNDQTGRDVAKFFYSAKVKNRKKSGNEHPTVKPTDLCTYLAQLILPPERNTPRRLLVPYSGSGSEMIGAINAGWDQITGIEMDDQWVKTAQRRLKAMKIQVSNSLDPGNRNHRPRSRSRRRCNLLQK